jgi:hypothetical protein
MTDMPEFYQESFHVKSKRGKKRCCAECGGEIEPGMNYVKAKGVWSGEFGYYMFHLTCHAVAMESWKFYRNECNLQYDETPAIGELLEWAVQELYESKCIPSYWPEGVPVTRVGLQRHAKDSICKPTGH